MNTILRYEWRMFLRNRIAVVAWILLFVAGLYAIYYGHSFNNVQLSTIIRIDTAYQKRIQTQLDNFLADTSEKAGKARFRTAHDPFMSEWALRPMVWKSPSPLQGMTIGQSDNQPFYYNIWVYNNVYNTKQVELRNPARLMAGNFDLAFVFIYLMPLLLIVLSYNLLSEDKEAGISRIFSIQGVSLRTVLYSRLLFRAMLLFSLVICLSAIGFVVNKVTDMYSVLVWLGVVSCYLLFWLVLVYAMNAAGKAGAVNALLLVSTWVILLLVIPSVINSFQDTEDAGRIRIADADREYGNHLQGLSKKAIVDTMFALKPEWKQYGIRDTNTLRSIAYSYLDMLNMNAIGRDIDSKALQQQEKLAWFNFINPAFSTQTLLNLAAGVELNSFADFRMQVSNYQLERTELINNYRVRKNSFDKKSFQAYPLFGYKRKPLPVLDLLWGLLPVLLLSLVARIIAGLL